MCVDSLIADKLVVRFSISNGVSIGRERLSKTHHFSTISKAARRPPTGISIFLDFSKNKNRPNLLMLFSKIVYPKGLFGKI